MRHALRLRTGIQKHFERHRAYKMFQELKLVFQIHARLERYETSDSTLPGYYDCLNQVGVNLPDNIVIDRVL